MATFTEAARALTERATGAATMTIAAEAMGDALVAAAGRYLGGDATMSGTGRTVTVETDGAAGTATVTPGGAWGLADGGRRVVRPARRPRGKRGLATPWGPRASVKGSTWPGFGIGAAAQTEVADAGRQAIREAVAR